MRVTVDLYGTWSLLFFLFVLPLVSDTSPYRLFKLLGQSMRYLIRSVSMQVLSILNLDTKHWVATASPLLISRLLFYLDLA